MMNSAAPPTPSNIAATTPTPTRALFTYPTKNVSGTNTANCSTGHPVLQAMTIDGISITADLLQMWAAEMRLKHADDALPEYVVKELEALPGWTWYPKTAAAIFAAWRVEADAGFAKAREKKYEYLEQRIKNVLDLRDKWLDESNRPPHLMSALRALTCHDIRGVILIPEDTDKMAAMDLLASTESPSIPSFHKTLEKVTGTRLCAWVREHLEQIYGVNLAAAADGLLTSLEDDPQKADIRAHLLQALNEKLTEISA